ncbi:mandelate racemase/muconate lactonizing enzyme family protein [Crystallibacter degradans]|uniref:mandelate racemase/muconate lactonizing enzyme family protein n=1 Tax=Crystallibacter degradans TaxID=2726743 RepID=UPI001F0E0BB0|nr:mandelate racemase/muconate lactonizing enzyme family protein [Arthrobacter sp. SF27]
MHFITVHTDTGLVGLGQSACWAYPSSVHAMMDQFRDYLQGEDPLRIERHHQHLYRMGPFRGAVLSAAVSAIDIALWDIASQFRQAPVFELLGGAYRDQVRLCRLLLTPETPDSMLDAVKDAAARAYTAVKFDPFLPGYHRNSAARTHHDCIELVSQVRSAVGPDIDILLELHRKLTPLEAMPIIESLGQFRPLFVEDAIQIDSISTQAELARRTQVPMANGERLHTIWEFAELLEQGGPQYLRPDPGLAGGFTGLRKIAALGEAHHSAIVTHNFLGPVLTAASVHFDLATPNVVLQEYVETDEDSNIHPALTTTLVRDGGYMQAPEGIGLGVTLEPELLTEESYLGFFGNFTHPRLRPDGSNANVV